jgi:hypothetical protein
MDEHSMRRYVPVLVAGSALIAAACSEPVAPRTPAAPQYVPIVSAHIVAEPANMWAIEQAGTFTFTLNPWGGTAKIGAYRLSYDANAVCNPATSGYGPSEWKKSCSSSGWKTAVPTPISAPTFASSRPRVS